MNHGASDPNRLWSLVVGGGGAVSGERAPSVTSGVPSMSTAKDDLTMPTVVNMTMIENKKVAIGSAI